MKRCGVSTACNVVRSTWDGRADWVTVIQVIAYKYTEIRCSTVRRLTVQYSGVRCSAVQNSP